MKQGFGKISRIAVPERDNHTCVSGDPGNSAGDHFWDGDENVTLKLRTVTGPRNKNINKMVTNWMIWIKHDKTILCSKPMQNLGPCRPPRLKVDNFKWVVTKPKWTSGISCIMDYTFLSCIDISIFRWWIFGKPSTFAAKWHLCKKSIAQRCASMNFLAAPWRRPFFLSSPCWDDRSGVPIRLKKYPQPAP